LKIDAALPPWINFLIFILVVEILLIICMNYKHILILFRILFFLLFCIYYWFYLTLSISKFAFSFFVILFDFGWDLVYGVTSCVLVQMVETAVWIVVFDFWILISLVLL
jgi:hypothetical protein